MSADPSFEIGAVCLGSSGRIAAWKRATSGAPYSWNPSLVISECAGVEDGAYVPASSITIYGTDALLALRAAVDDALRYYEKGPA